MFPNEPDWKKELSPPPLQGKGFDDKLQRRIEEQLDRNEARRRKRLWLWPAVGSCCMLAVAGTVWLAAPLADAAQEEPAPVTAAEPVQAVPASSEAQPAAKPTVAIKTGVLIGLREDHTEADGTSPESTYRTLLLAPVDGEVRVAAEGGGILVPYGQKFWKIDSLTYRTGSDSIQYLNAYPADKPAELIGFTDNPDEYVHYSEKLIFAGNQYVSVEEYGAVGTKDSSSVLKRVWVRKLNQMNASAADGFGGRGTDAEHVSVMDIFGEGARGILSGMSQPDDSLVMPKAVRGENWTITRKPGRWTAQVAEVYKGSGYSTSDYRLQDYPTALPETVTAHDSVCCTWGQIRRMQPDAKDLLSSPLEDMVVVFTDRELVVHSPAIGSEQAKPLLRVALRPGEKLVSAQWATGPYVPVWVEKVRKYLGQPTEK